MSYGYFEIRLVGVSQQKGEIKNTNPKPTNINNNMESSLWGGGWGGAIANLE